MKSVKWFLSFLKKYRLWMCAGLVMTTMIAAISIVNPYISGAIVDDVILAENYGLLPKLLVILLGVTALKVVLTFLYQMAFETASQGVLYDMRDAVYRKLLEEDFYNAVKARNLYNRDDCKDLGSMLKGILPKEKIDEILSSAIKRCSYLPKKDPVELTERYLSVIDAVEQKIDRNMTIGICHEYWALKARYLKELGINWSSPAVLNPSVMFD